MSPEQRMAIGMAAYTLASDVQAGDAARVQAATVSTGAGDPNQVAFLVRSTAARTHGDALRVTQAYLLDNSAPAAEVLKEADFSCPLMGTASEVDFGISGLPRGRFAFASVQATGADPWALNFLLQADAAGLWKMAGFYPHALSAAGHDGLWYWTSARADAKTGKPWLAWLLFGEAESLLRPAAFVSSSNLEKLDTERHTAAPQPLTNGLSSQAPLTLNGDGGAVYRVEELRAQGSDDGKSLNLWMRLAADPATAGNLASGTERNVAAGRALLTQHPELRGAFAELVVLADVPGGAPVTVERPLAQFAAGAE